MADHTHDENCGCGEDHEEQVFMIPDDDGNEVEMVLVYTFETEGNIYAVLLERNNPEADGVIFRLEEEEDSAYLVNIEDNEEWDRVVAVYNELAEQDEEEEQ